MTISEKLTKIAENVPKVYEAGKKSEYDRFWDTIQNYGAKTDYGYSFAGALWTDDIFKPKYDIICKSAVNMFRFADITDSKVSIDVSGANSTYMFYSCQNLKTVRKIIVNENNLFTGFLQSCPNLEEVRFEGTIGKSFDIHWSTKLSYDSVANIFGHLGGTASATLTLPQSHNDGRYASLIADMPPNWAVSWL